MDGEYQTEYDAEEEWLGFGVSVSMLLRRFCLIAVFSLFHFCSFSPSLGGKYSDTTTCIQEDLGIRGKEAMMDDAEWSTKVGGLGGYFWFTGALGRRRSCREASSCLALRLGITVLESGTC